MSEFVSTSSGTISVDPNDLSRGEYFLRDLIWQVERGVKRGGFEKSEVMGIMINWFRIGQNLRNPQYARFYHQYFIRDAPSPPAGKKASQVLMIKLRRLEGYPPHAGADARAAYFSEAETAMYTFINEYRKVMATMDPDTLKYFIFQVQTMGSNGRV